MVLREWSVRWKGNYENDKRDGFWKHFNEDGTLDRTETFKNGVKVE